MSAVSYTLVIALYAVGSPPIISQVRGFQDIFACERAAAQATTLAGHSPMDRGTVHTICVADRVYALKGR